MRNFRGPLPRCLGSDDSTDGEDEDLDFVYVNDHPLLFTDDSDVTDEFDETDRFAFNLVFNNQNYESSGDEEVGQDEDLEEEEEEGNANGVESDGIIIGGRQTESPVNEIEEGSSVNEELLSGSSTPNQDYLIALEVDSNGSVGCSLVDRRNMSVDERDSVILPGSGGDSPSIHVVHVGGESRKSLRATDSSADVEMAKPSPSPTWSPSESPGEVKPSSSACDANDSDDSYHHQYPEKIDAEVRCASVAGTESDHGVEEQEQFCNPMASDSDGEDEDENECLLRGDRIGATTYSERHVLKILISWMEKLPTFGKVEPSEETPEGVDSPLDQDFEDAMSLLWDMTAETDVIHFLMSHSILTLIRDTVDTDKCPTRLKEVALGILANVLSCPSILEVFPEKDEEFHLVDRVVMEALSCTKIPLLIQVFAVLRRVVCYVRNAKPLERWMNFLLHEDFISASNFLLASSTNGILLGDVIMTLFTLMEVLGPANEDHSISEKERKEVESLMTEKFKPFCESEFVPSLCEGLNELLKDSRSLSRRLSINQPTDPRKLPQCGTTGNGPDECDYDVAPPGHVQSAVLNGIGSLAYLQKFQSGKDVLRRHSNTVINVLTTILDKFRFCTERVEGPEMLDYFALAMDLLEFCFSTNEDKKLKPEQVLVPASTSMWLTEEAAKQHETHVVNIGTESKSVDVELDSSKSSPYAIIFFNYLVTLKGTFGDHVVEELMTSSGERYKQYYHKVLRIAQDFNGSEDILEITQGESSEALPNVS